MALIDKETIRAEIERLMQIARYQWRPQSEQLCQHILDFLDSLPEQQEGLHFTPLNRLIQKIPSKNWNNTVNNYAKKLRDCLIKEGYLKDAKVLQDYISYMNGNNVSMATMDEETDEPKDLDIPGFEGVKVHPGNMPEYEPKCLWGDEPSEESCRYCSVWCSLRKPEPNSESSTNLDSKDDAVGLSIMLYLDTHVKHENSKVCGVPLKVAREWLRRHIGKDEPKRDCSFAVDEDLQNQVDLLEQEVELERELADYFGNIPDDTDKTDIARHFAEWGAEHAQK